MVLRTLVVLAAATASFSPVAVGHGNPPERRAPVTTDAWTCTAGSTTGAGVSSQINGVDCDLGSSAAVSRPAQPAPPATSSPSARFVREATRIELRDDAVLVAFQEVGLQPGAASTIEVGVERTTSLRCTVPGAPDQVVLDTSSSASVTETTTVVADEHGQIRGERLLQAAPGTVQIEGFDCTTTERITVVLGDLTSGATLTVEQ